MAIKIGTGSSGVELKRVDLNGGLHHWSVTLEASAKGDNPEVQGDFDKIVSGMAHEVLRAGAERATDHNEMGGGAKSYGGLKECGCEVLGRSVTNRSRELFEKSVIHRMGPLAQDASKDSIHITAFATGLLFGEFVILSKFIKELSDKNINKKVVFSFIDYTYDVLDDGFVKTHRKNKNIIGWKRDIDKAVNQLLQTVNAIINLNSVKFSSQIELRFFKSADDYVDTCELDSEFKHDILVGADRGDTDEIIYELDAMRRGSVDAVFLERASDKEGKVVPRLHLINSATALNKMLTIKI